MGLSIGRIPPDDADDMPSHAGWKRFYRARVAGILTLVCIRCERERGYVRELACKVYVVWPENDGPASVMCAYCGVMEPMK